MSLLFFIYFNVHLSLLYFLLQYLYVNYHFLNMLFLAYIIRTDSSYYYNNYFPIIY